ncbi:hypothetical protein PUN28_007955 [Cardiocondyla obscurior]|uniref:Uncharacterized protein n=1 Tax=Cardiocondyla obscurior TaxID=286306 RepID=A0AAW2G181_9HYME
MCLLACLFHSHKHITSELLFNLNSSLCQERPTRTSFFPQFLGSSKNSIKSRRSDVRCINAQCRVAPPSFLHCDRHIKAYTQCAVLPRNGNKTSN